MIPGVLGYSLIFELFVLYVAWHLWFSQWKREWFYVFLFILLLLSLVSFTPGAWVQLLNGDFSFILDDVLRALGW